MVTYYRFSPRFILKTAMKETKNNKILWIAHCSPLLALIMSQWYQQKYTTLKGEVTSRIDKASFLEVNITFYHSYKNSWRCMAAFICVIFTLTHNS